MSDTGYPNVLIVNPDGTINALISGSLVIPADTGGSFPLGLDPLHAVRWTDAQGRSVAALGGWVDNADTRGMAVMNAYTPNGQSIVSLQETATPTLSSLLAYVQAGAAFDQVDILDSNGNSEFQRLIAPSSLQMQVGATTIAANAGGAQFYVFNLGQPWPTQHVRCFAWVAGAANYTGVPSNYGSQPSGLGQGAIVLSTTFVQSLTIGYISFGF